MAVVSAQVESRFRPGWAAAGDHEEVMRLATEFAASESAKRRSVIDRGEAPRAGGGVGDERGGNTLHL